MQNVKDAANAVSEKVKETAAAGNNPLSSGSGIVHARNATQDHGIVRAWDVTQDRVEEKGHKAKKKGQKESAEECGVIASIVDTLSNAYNYVAEKAAEATNETDPDSDNIVGGRVGVRFSAIGDDIEQYQEKDKM